MSSSMHRSRGTQVRRPRSSAIDRCTSQCCRQRRNTSSIGSISSRNPSRIFNQSIIDIRINGILFKGLIRNRTLGKIIEGMNVNSCK